MLTIYRASWARIENHGGQTVIKLFDSTGSPVMVELSKGAVTMLRHAMKELEKEEGQECS